MTRSSAVAGIALTALLSACDTSQYNFKVDERIEIVSPEERQTVDLPVVVTWTDEEPPSGAEVAPRKPTAAYYAVFVDRSPVGPGDDLASVAEDPAECRESPDCPSADILRDRGVYLSAVPTVTLEFLRDLRPGDKGDDVHEVTLVRMRGDRRAGEAAFRVTFLVRRPR